jgi:sigma-B regulation protein RsbU (phosphoserine phosphatase)
MSALIDNLMDFARGRLGGGIELNLQFEPTLQTVLSQVLEEFKTIDPDREIVATFDLDKPIKFDSARMAQLVSNLLGNALTYGDPAHPICLHAATSEPALELFVANAGKPIPEHAREKLFQPFYRGEASGSKGLGLGLHIACEIAKAHGGDLTVSSDDVETRFTLRVPIL